LPSSELEALPSLLKLRNALYSQEFRDFLCAVTGVKGLSGIKTDMSINTYLKGGHLLTHDDVIGTRCVSFILYLVQGDCEGGWKDAWGGGLRLYKTSDDGVPENEPCLTIPPKWNQMSMFGISSNVATNS
jgi:prolyl 3-hydroxylase /prolyl 3,4-dihydroxylase